MYAVSGNALYVELSCGAAERELWEVNVWAARPSCTFPDVQRVVGSINKGDA